VCCLVLPLLSSREETVDYETSDKEEGLYFSERNYSNSSKLVAVQLGDKNYSGTLSITPLRAQLLF
jgi:hypothetical protein